MAIIKNILDNDLYKFTMQQAILELFPNTKVKYYFKNRGKEKFNKKFLNKLKKEIEKLEKLSLTNREYNFLKNNCKFLKPQYLEFLKNYKYKKNEVIPFLDKNNNLVLEIEGYWYSTILWEVPLLSLISELYYKYVDTNWGINYFIQKEKAIDKINILSIKNCKFADFGTRRRRSYKIQDFIIKTFLNRQKKIKTKNQNKYFIGTSNVHFAQKYNIKPIGTYAHEWVMGNAITEGLRHANYNAMNNWIRVYNTQLGIALTDTYGLNAFLNNFNRRMAMLYDGVRHDSGNPYDFITKIVEHYKKININPLSKTIIFSDGLDKYKAINIKHFCQNKINCSFGIGTNFTNNHFDNSALNIVIKLKSVMDNNKYVPVVKLSDSPGKEMGDKKAINVAKWTFNQRNNN